LEIKKLRTVLLRAVGWNGRTNFQPSMHGNDQVDDAKAIPGRRVSGRRGLNLWRVLLNPIGNHAETRTDASKKSRNKLLILDRINDVTIRNRSRKII